MEIPGNRLLRRHVPNDLPKRFSVIVVVIIIVLKV
jgi:hypothetical protein